MHRAQATMVGFFVGAAALAMGCNGGGSSTTDVGSSQARLVLAAKGSTPATVHVTATDDATAAVVFDKTVEIQGGSATVMDVSLPPAAYTFTAGASSGASRNAPLGSDSAHVTLDGEALTQINVDASVTAGNGPAQVQIGVDAAPVIKGIDAQTGPDATVQLTVDVGGPSDASDASDGTLHFFWSGAGLHGAVEGPSSLTLPVAALMDATSSADEPVLHVVVQNAQGTSTDADVTLSIVNGEIQSLTTSIGAATNACLDAQAQCNAACASDLALGESPTVSIAPCLAQCSLSLASCKAS